MCATAVFRFDGDHPRLAVHGAGFHSHLAAVQFAAMELQFLTFRVRQNTYAAQRLDLHVSACSDFERLLFLPS